MAIATAATGASMKPCALLMAMRSQTPAAAAAAVVVELNVKLRRNLNQGFLKQDCPWSDACCMHGVAVYTEWSFASAENEVWPAWFQRSCQLPLVWHVGGCFHRHCLRGKEETQRKRQARQTRSNEQIEGAGCTPSTQNILFLSCCAARTLTRAANWDAYLPQPSCRARVCCLFQLFWMFI